MLVSRDEQELVGARKDFYASATVSNEFVVRWADLSDCCDNLPLFIIIRQSAMIVYNNTISY